MKAGSSLLFASVALGVIYTGLMLALPSGAFFSGEEGVRWLQVDSLWRHRWTSLAVNPPGAELDPDALFILASLHKTDGEVHSLFSVGLPLLASVPYALLGMRGIYLTPAAAAILCMAASARLARFVMSAGWAALAGIASVAASPLIFYGATFWEHTLAVALCVAGLIPICKMGGKAGPNASVRLGLAGGILLGLAAAFRTEAALLLPAVVIAGAIAWGWLAFKEAALALAAGAAVVLVPRAVYHHALLGSYLPPHLAAGRPGGMLGLAVRSPRAMAVDFLSPVVWRPLFAGVVILLVIIWMNRRRARDRPPGQSSSRLLSGAALLLTALMIAGGPLLTLTLELADRSLSPQERGFQSLLSTAPIVALIPLALLPQPASPRPHLRFLGWTATVFVLLAVALTPVSGAMSWGPRRLLPAVPLLTIALMALLAGGREREAGRGRLATACLGIVLAMGLALQVCGLRTLVAVRKSHATVLERVQKAVPPGSVILSDFLPVPQLLATLSGSTPALYVRAGSDLGVLDERLEARDITPYWIVRKKSGEDGGVGPAVLSATIYLDREAEIDLGAGLLLIRDEPEAGVRGFARTPMGD